MKNDLKIFTDNIQPEATNQIYNLISQVPFEDSVVRIMPDVHCGMECVVGFTSTFTDKLIPNVIGVDIGCGMLTINLGNVDIDLARLDEFIKKTVVVGSTTKKKYNIDPLVNKLLCKNKLKDCSLAYQTFATLGGGNHFIEVDIDNDNNKYLIIHSGSRGLGLLVAKYYQQLAIDECKNAGAIEKQKLVEELSKSGQQEKIDTAMAELTKKYAHKTKTPASYCYLEGKQMQDYLYDIRICQQFAEQSRKHMADQICNHLRIKPTESFETVHNFIDTDNIIRKGAIPAHLGQKVLIPLNMRDGCIIAIGKGNTDWNNSAPHGAGRLIKRSEAKEYFTLEEYKEEMKGIYTTSVTSATLDESPMVYKPMDEILKYIEPTVKIQKIIKPIYNFKSAE
ncbi:MAG: RtcB family protein [Clostridia bacterium]|nr:RtcB family protein [Clostridia bacterium]